MKGMSEKEERDERNDQAYKAIDRAYKAKWRAAKRIKKTRQRKSADRSTMTILGLPIEHLPTIADLIGDDD